MGGVTDQERDLEAIAERMIYDDHDSPGFVHPADRRAVAIDYLRRVRRPWRSRVWAELSTIRGVFGKAGR